MKRIIPIALLSAFMVLGYFSTEARAYYDPGTGRFISRDPGADGPVRAAPDATVPEGGRFLKRDPIDQEYGDGMNLYGAYFVPGEMDPYGNAKIKGSVSLGDDATYPNGETAPYLDMLANFNYNPCDEFCCCERIYWRQYYDKVEVWKQWLLLPHIVTSIESRQLDGGKYYTYQKSTGGKCSRNITMTDNPGMSLSKLKTLDPVRTLLFLSQSFETQLICDMKGGKELILKMFRWSQNWSRKDLDPVGSITHTWGPKTIHLEVKDPCATN
ncbi:MAG: hypothetical protein V1809_06910 [Planctomycetota bacterium]